MQKYPVVDCDAFRHRYGIHLHGDDVSTYESESEGLEQWKKDAFQEYEDNKGKEVTEYEGTL